MGMLEKLRVYVPMLTGIVVGKSDEQQKDRMIV